MKPRHYPFLDGFRGFAVFCVLMFHGREVFRDLQYGLIPVITKISDIGYVGVTMFFVLSGFLITGVLIENWHDKLRIKRFYIRRFFKIYPMYIFCLIISIITLNFQGYLNWQWFLISDGARIKVLSHFIFLQNYFPYVKLLWHTWSLAVEEHFYLIYPLLLAIVFNVYKQEAKRRAAAIWVIILFIIIINIIRFIYQSGDIVIFNFIIYNVNNGSHYKIDALLFGCLIKILEPYYEKRDRGSHWTGSICFILSILSFTAIMFMDRLVIFDEFFLAYFASGLMLLAGYYQVPILRILYENRAIKWIGKYSYGIYLWHFFVLKAISIMFGHVHDLIIFAVYMVLTVVFGVITTNTIERPFLRLRNNVAP